MATAWDIVFNDIRKSEFSSDDVQAELARFRDQNGLTISESSPRRMSSVFYECIRSNSKIGL